MKILAYTFAHFVIYITTFGYVFAIGDSGKEAPFILEALVITLGAPFLLLLQFDISFLSPQNRWWGDDSNLIIGLAFINSLLWGVIINFMVNKIKPRNQTPNKSSNLTGAKDAPSS